MAAYNKTLGRFQLSGIPPAPRGVPQIEVKFDIDANGIVNVSAKDLGTGKEQNITIQSSSGLSDEEIEKMVKEAEANAEADRKHKEEVEIRNQADSLVYQTEKSLKEMGDKIEAQEKEKIEKAVAELKTALEGKDTANIKAKSEALTEELYKITSKMYQQANPQGQGPASDEQAPQDDNVVDAEYEEIKDDEQK